MREEVLKMQRAAMRKANTMMQMLGQQSSQLLYSLSGSLQVKGGQESGQQQQQASRGAITRVSPSPASRMP